MRHLSSHDAVSGADNNDEAGPRRSAACGARRVRSRRFQAGLGRLSEAGPRGADGAPLVERGGFVGSGWSAAVGAKRVHGERDDGEVGPWGARHSHRGETGSGVWPPDPSSYSPAPPDLGGMDAAAGRIREGGRGHERESEESAYLGRLLENAEFWVSTRLASATQMRDVGDSLTPGSESFTPENVLPVGQPGVNGVTNREYMSLSVIVMGERPFAVRRRRMANPSIRTASALPYVFHRGARQQFARQRGFVVRFLSRARRTSLPCVKVDSRQKKSPPGSPQMAAALTAGRLAPRGSVCRAPCVHDARQSFKLCRASSSWRMAKINR
jgi:hypothetical protein